MATTSDEQCDVKLTGPLEGDASLFLLRLWSPSWVFLVDAAGVTGK